MQPKDWGWHNRSQNRSSKDLLRPTYNVPVQSGGGCRFHLSLRLSARPLTQLLQPDFELPSFFGVALRLRDQAAEHLDFRREISRRLRSEHTVEAV